jgi:hypothetical protein
MTSSTVPEITVNQNDLPEDIFSYIHEKFYGFIKEKYGADLSELLTFQAIRSGAHLLSASADDILLIFQEDSDDINKLKELCCFPIAGNKYQVKLGVKLAINNLIQSLKIKQEQQKKKKRSRTERPSLNLDVTTFNNQTQPQNKMSSPPSTLLVPSLNDTSSPPSTSFVPSPNDTTSARSTMSPIQQKLNEIDHKNDIEERINNWWKSLNGDDNSSLDEGTHYTVEINKSINDTYACILTCKCHGRFKLSFMTSGIFKLSSFCRHLKEKQCVKPSKVVSLFHVRNHNYPKFFKFRNMVKKIV